MRDTLVIVSDLHRIRDARVWATRHASSAGFPADRCWAIELALGEALANVIRHGYDGRSDLNIELVLSIDEEKLEIEIHDSARPFERDSVSVPPLDVPRTGGYGLHLIDELMDEVEYAGDDRGGLLRMVMWRHA